MIENFLKCACGCGQRVTWHKRRKCWNTFINHHNRRKAKHTFESKRKMSKSHQGKNLSLQHKENIADSLKGRKRKKETKIKIGIGHLERAKAYVLKTGYCNIWHDREYKEDLKLDECSICGITDQESINKYKQPLCLHHKDGDRTNCHPDNFDTQCCSCHRKTHIAMDINFSADKTFLVTKENKISKIEMT